MTRSLTDLPLEQKVGQLFFIGIPGPTVDAATRELLDEVSPGGVCLFARNIREERQTRELLDSLSVVIPATPLLSIDQEGGLVDRLRRVTPPMPSASKMRDAADAGRLGSLIGETLRVLGFNMDFAPVVDVIDEARARENNGLFSREFGRSQQDVATFGAAFSGGLRQHGILNCLKHFPGLGASKVDSHEELPEVVVGEAELEEIDLHPYRQLLDNADSVMVAHAAYPTLSLQERDQNGRLLPSSLSPNIVTTLLRERLGFGGLVITDDLEMGAIVRNYGIADACRLALQAGSDMLAICADPSNIRAGYQGLLQAVRDGQINEMRIDASLERIAAVKDKIQEPFPFDAERLHRLSDAVESFNQELSL